MPQWPRGTRRTGAGVGTGRRWLTAQTVYVNGGVNRVGDLVRASFYHRIGLEDLLTATKKD
jgi:hypothetical protein